MAGEACIVDGVIATNFSDPADYASASYEHHPVDDIEPIDVPPDERADAIRTLLAIIVSRKNKALAVECLCIATGLGFAEGKTMTDVARRFGIKKQTVSKDVRQMMDELNLPPSPYMRSMASRETFRLTNCHPTQKL